MVHVLDSEGLQLVAHAIKGLTLPPACLQSILRWRGLGRATASGRVAAWLGSSLMPSPPAAPPSRTCSPPSKR